MRRAEIERMWDTATDEQRQEFCRTHNIARMCMQADLVVEDFHEISFDKLPAEVQEWICLIINEREKSKKPKIDINKLLSDV